MTADSFDLTGGACWHGYRRKGEGDPARQMVPAGDPRQQCARSRSRSIHLRRSAPHRPVPQTLCRAQPSPQVRPVPLGDVDADVLHQPCGESALVGPTRATRAGERRSSRSLRQTAPDVGRIASSEGGRPPNPMNADHRKRSNDLSAAVRPTIVDLQLPHGQAGRQQGSRAFSSAKVN